MKIVACFKNVPDERDITFTKEGSIDLSRAPFSIGKYDLNALEAGAVLSEQVPECELIALTASGEEALATKAKKDVLSRGADELVVALAEDVLIGDPVQTGSVLAKAIQEIGAVDLILFGEGSGDMYNRSVGITTASKLGIPVLNGVFEIEVEEGSITVKRRCDDVVQTMSIATPCAICVTSDANVPRIASMKAILGAGKKPSSSLELDVESRSAEIETITEPVKAERKHVIFEDDSDASLDGFVQALKQVL